MNSHNHNPRSNGNGFSLLEMLVVIGLVAIIVSLGLASFSHAQKLARDSRRASDLQSMQSALEQYYANCGYVYPLPNAQGAYESIACTSPVESYISRIPVDPLTGTAYQCVGNCDAQEYTLCPPIVRSAAGVDYFMETGDCSASDTNCCIVNRQ